MAVSPALGASFRDPSGFVYERDGRLLRQVNKAYAADFALLKGSGLLEELTEKGLLVQHREVEISLQASPEAIAILEPVRIPMVSYPYEWCFSQLKDAALSTLDIQVAALAKGMSLKDASAYNIQFLDGRPLLIDTLSFEAYEEGAPWVAYRQFCQHFLAPLALMAKVDVRLVGLLARHLDGIPLDLAAKLLPARSRFNLHLLSHIHIHAKAQSKRTEPGRNAARIGLRGLMGILDSLRSAIQALKWDPCGTEWGDYYEATNYSDEAMAAKERLVVEYLEAVRPVPASVWDLGANDGRFSRISADRGIQTVAWDLDPAAVERAYRSCKASGIRCLLPLLQDLANPSPSIGWAHRERLSLIERGPVDLVMALALIHHLAIGNNVPLPRVAAFLAEIGQNVIVEFVDKADSQVQHMLASREDVFPGYSPTGFDAAFEPFFTVVRRDQIAGTRRTMSLMKRRASS